MDIFAFDRGFLGRRPDGREDRPQICLKAMQAFLSAMQLFLSAILSAMPHLLSATPHLLSAILSAMPPLLSAMLLLLFAVGDILMVVLSSMKALLAILHSAIPVLIVFPDVLDIIPIHFRDIKARILKEKLEKKPEPKSQGRENLKVEKIFHHHITW
jgi:hypothetical protein